jgi:ABC-type bacteriocin/lantibiotic exporter with double-glycine peptidase domain
MEQVIAQKQQAQIFLFDEADNALDKKNQEEFDQQLKKLLKQNKLIIYTIKV